MKWSTAYYEVARWASIKRDTLRGTPMQYRDSEARAWADGYKWAMNEVTQHFNMERVKAEKEGQ